MKPMLLWQVLLGAKPKGRNIEQHDITFVAGATIDECVPALREFWPVPGVHADSYMPVRVISDYQVHVLPKGEVIPGAVPHLKLYFINLGGYDPGNPEELHQRLIIAAPSLEAAKLLAKGHHFFTSRKGSTNVGPPHIDDKYEIDDIVSINDLLPECSIQLTPKYPGLMLFEPVVNGYFPLEAADPFRKSEG